uniref:Peptidase C1A papain C-terminal domain-containing protein n=1 Tax=Tetranychus urticae TaxID=32264 RepID=T1KIL8_TETUR
MFHSIVLLACLALTFASEVDYKSDENNETKLILFQINHNKNYAHPKEEAYRFQVFSSNLKKITEHNKRHSNGLETYDMGVNAYTDLTFAEFSKAFLGYNATLQQPAPLIHNRNSTDDLPETVDWREKGIINAIKNQGQCGSCWAFSTTASVESAWAQAKGKLVSLSEQNLMDCSYAEGNNGCSGGLPDKAFNYIIKNGGVDTEDSYNYTAASSKTCKFSSSNVGAKISKFVDIESGDEAALKNAVAQRVVSVAIHVGETFQNYKSGIFDLSFCPSWSFYLNHAVAVVGYGTDHWLLRNSWGSSWGENGYARFAINKNLCGIASAASYPLV